MTNFQLLGSLLASPRRFFGELEAQPRFALPLCVALLTSAGLVFWFYSIVDIGWLIDQSLSANPRAAQMTEEQRAAAARFFTRGMATWTSVGSTLVLILLLRVLEATGYKLAARLVGLKRTFRQWFALAWWTSLPGVIAIVPAALTLMFARGAQLTAGAIQPLSLNELFFHRPLGTPAYNLLANVSVLSVVTLGLAVFGVRCWSQRSWGHAMLVVLLPVALVYVPWAAFALGRP